MDFDGHLDKIEKIVLTARLRAYENLLEEFKMFEYTSASQMIGAIHSSIELHQLALEGEKEDV